MSEHGAEAEPESPSCGSSTPQSSRQRMSQGRRSESPNTPRKQRSTELGASLGKARPAPPEANALARTHRVRKTTPPQAEAAVGAQPAFPPFLVNVSTTGQPEHANLPPVVSRMSPEPVRTFGDNRGWAGRLGRPKTLEET